MINKPVFLICSSLFLAANYLSAQDNASRKVLLSLQQGESIMTNESCIQVSASADQLYLVTWMDKKLYVYENGQRKGPFASPNDVKVRNCGDHGNSNSECAVYVPSQQNQIQEYVGFTDKGEYTIKLNGKTYGPYKYVTNLNVSPDKSMFVAIIADDQMKYSLVTSGGVQQNLDGTIDRMIVSPSGKQYLVILKENAGGPSMQNIDFSKMTPEELMKMVQEQATAQEKAGEPQSIIIGTGGKQIGKYKSSLFYDNNPAYCQSGSDNWYMIIDNGLYVNGQLLKQFDSDVSLSTCKIWLSKDGKRFAIVGYDKIIFSDGKSYPAAINLQVDNSGDKTVLKWIALENEKELVSYSKEL
jgi:hypothetical protein